MQRHCQTCKPCAELAEAHAAALPPPIRSDYRCPVGKCERRKEPWHLCCSGHWFKLPKAVRDRIWDLFRTEEGSEKHRRACLEALAELERAA